MNLQPLKALSAQWSARTLFEMEGWVCNTHPLLPPENGSMVRYGVDWLRFTVANVPKSTYIDLISILHRHFHVGDEERTWPPDPSFLGLPLALHGGIFSRHVSSEPVSRAEHEERASRRGDGVKFRKDAKGDIVAIESKILTDRAARDFVDVLIELPATALDYIRGLGFTELDLLKMAAVTCEERTVIDGNIEKRILHGLQPARVDIAADCFDKRINVRMMLDALDNDHVSRKFHTWDYQSGKRKRGQPIPDDTKGESMTVKLGTRGSSRYGRCYDKKAETYTKLKIEIPHCSRFEMECLHDGAEEVGRKLLAMGLEAIPGIWRDWCDVKTFTGSNRITRRETIWWWKVVTGNADKVVLGLQRGMATPDKTIVWLAKQVAQAAVCAKTYAPEQWNDLVASAEVKITEDKKAVWADWAKRQKEKHHGNTEQRVCNLSSAESGSEAIPDSV